MNNHNFYEPNKYLKLGVKVWPQMAGELIRCRELIWRLFIRDVSVKYRQAVLGNLWIFIMPFIAIGTFMYLNRVGVLNIGETSLPYPLFALIGLTVWQLFATGINSGCNSLVAAGDMITKINFPRETLVVAAMAATIFEFCVKCLLIIVLLFIFRFMPAWGALLFPVAILPVLILTLGLSFILSLLNGVLRDTANVVSLLVTFFMFLTPVLYPIPDYHMLMKLNLLSPLITGPRDLIAYGTLTRPADFFIASFISVFIFLAAWRIFHLAETKIPERV